MAASAPLACARAIDPEAGPAGPEGVVDAGEERGDAADAAPVADAGACSTSGLCVTQVPIDPVVQLTSVRGSSASDVWAVGAHGTILHYDGAVWEKADDVSAFSQTLRGVWLERPDDVWIVEGQKLRHTVGWRGPSDTEWTFGSLAPGNLWGPIGGSGDVVWTTTYGDPFYLVTYEGWADGGPVTTRASQLSRAGAVDGFEALTMTRSDEVWLSGFRSVTERGPGCVLRGTLTTSDGGVPDAPALPWEFEEFDIRTESLLVSGWGDESGAWLVGNGGTIRHIERSAIPDKTFDVVPSRVRADLHGVFGFGRDDVWVVGEESTVLHWDGKEWSKLATPFDDAGDKPAFFSVWGSSASDVWIAATGAMLHFQR